VPSFLLFFSIAYKKHYCLRKCLQNAPGVVADMVEAIALVQVAPIIKGVMDMEEPTAIVISVPSLLMKASQSRISHNQRTSLPN
jgi:hypothetical protein